MLILSTLCAFPSRTKRPAFNYGYTEVFYFQKKGVNPAGGLSAASFTCRSVCVIILNLPGNFFRFRFLFSKAENLLRAATDPPSSEGLFAVDALASIPAGLYYCYCYDTCCEGRISGVVLIWLMRNIKNFLRVGM